VIKNLRLQFFLYGLQSSSFRGRKGAGSLTFTGGDLDVFENLGLPSSFKDPKDVENSIQRAVKLMGELLNKNTITFSTALYPILSERTCCAALWDVGKKNVFEVLKEFEQNYKEFRKNVSKPERIVFGLPINLSRQGVEKN